MNKKILLLLILLLIPIIYAQEFDVKYKAVKSDIQIDETAEFEITITNYNNYADRFRFESILDDQWSYSSKPNYLSGIEVSARSEEKISLFVYPNIVTAGQHAIKIAIKSDKTGNGKIIWPVVNVKSTGGYVPPTEANIAGAIQINNDNKIDPRKENILRVILKNKNALFIDNLTLNVESDLINLKKEGIQLTALEEEKIEFKFKIDEKTLPRKENIIIKWTAKGKDFEYSESFDIIGYEAEFSRKTDIEKKILKRIEVIEVKNTGTLEKEEEINVETSGFKRLFTFTNPNAYLKKIDDKNYLVYKIKLKPGETIELETVTNYRIPIYLIILIAIVLYTYYKYRSPVVIKKKATIAKMIEGGISEIKILLHVKNRSNKTVDEIEIIDTIPHIGEMDKEIQIGTIKPVSIAKHKKLGTVVKWSIMSLERFEERIITYRIRSKLSILGGLMLPASKVRFKDKGKERTFRSNNLRLKV